MSATQDVIAKYFYETDERTTGDPAAGAKAKDIVAALDAAGFVIVPKKPTEAMKDAGAERLRELEQADVGTDYVISETFAAMIAAAQKV